METKEIELEEIEWFKKIKKKITKYVLDDRWDMISLPNLVFSVVRQICLANDVNELSPAINERIVDNCIEIIEQKFKKATKEIKKAKQAYENLEEEI